MIIRDNPTVRVSKNFTMSEWYSRSPDAPASHEIDDRLILVLQSIRDYYDKPVRITSTFRTRQHNKDVGGVWDSMHTKGIAVDFYIKDHDSFENFRDSLKSFGQWYTNLRDMGIAGIGIYNTFVHIDTRNEKITKAFNAVDSFGKVSRWGKWS